MQKVGNSKLFRITKGDDIVVTLLPTIWPWYYAHFGQEIWYFNQTVGEYIICNTTGTGDDEDENCITSESGFGSVSDHGDYQDLFPWS